MFLRRQSPQNIGSRGKIAEFEPSIYRPRRSPGHIAGAAGRVFRGQLQRNSTGRSAAGWIEHLAPDRVNPTLAQVNVDPSQLAAGRHLQRRRSGRVRRVRIVGQDVNLLSGRAARAGAQSAIIARVYIVAARREIGDPKIALVIGLLGRVGGKLPSPADIRVALKVHHHHGRRIAIRIAHMPADDSLRRHLDRNVFEILPGGKNQGCRSASARPCSVSLRHEPGLFRRERVAPGSHVLKRELAIVASGCRVDSRRLPLQPQDSLTHRLAVQGHHAARHANLLRTIRRGLLDCLLRQCQRRANHE